MQYDKNITLWQFIRRVNWLKALNPNWQWYAIAAVFVWAGCSKDGWVGGLWMFGWWVMFSLFFCIMALPVAFRQWKRQNEEVADSHLSRLPWR